MQSLSIQKVNATCGVDYSKENPSVKTPIMQKTVNLLQTKIKRLVSIRYEFLLKGLFDQALEGIEH